MKTIIFLLLAVLLTTCGETVEGTKDQLPPITQTGENTFGCLFNGGLFLPAKSGTFNTIPEGSPITVYGYYSETDSSSIRIDAVRRKDRSNIHYIWLYIYKFHSIGVSIYELGDPIYHETNFQPTHCYISCRAVSPVTGKYKFYGSYDGSGEIVITYKDNLGIFSGTFQATLREDGGTEIVQITDGRFDINPKTRN